MNKIEKALKKLSASERQVFKRMLISIQSGKLSNLDIKKLKGRTDIYRVKKVKMRIIFQKIADDDYRILTLERKSDNTY